MRFLSDGVKVLTANNGLTNAQIESLVDQMNYIGNLTNFSGNPIPYLTNNIAAYNGPGPQGPPGPPGPAGQPWTIADGITALGTNQSNSVSLVTNICFIDSSAPGTGANILPAVKGLYMFIQNNTANTVALYPIKGGTDLFYGEAANAALTGGLGAYSSITLYCATTGIIRSN